MCSNQARGCIFSSFGYFCNTVCSKQAGGSVIKRPTDSIASTTNGQTDTMREQTSTTSRQKNGQTSTTSEKMGTTSR